MKKLKYTEPVYTYHIDFVGHVNNIIYIEWMENARNKLIQAMGLSITEIAEKENMLPIITGTTIQYIKPFYLNSEVHVEIWVSKLLNASAIFQFRFLNENNEVCSTGEQKVLFINAATQKPARLIDKFRDAFGKFLVLD
ncbi:MAG: thioesterase family protein [Draconibacterium sp.]